MCIERRVDNVYVLGDDTGHDLVEGTYKFIAYDYESGYYDGSGDAYYLDNDNQLWHQDLGHCSCYGPFEDGWTKVELSELRTDSVHDLGSSQTLEETILELVEMYK